MRTVAALFVESDGPYANLPGVDVWDEARDARLYDGPHPVVAHPPCNTWSNGLSDLNQAMGRIVIGDDGGCFASALDRVRQCGGVLEHPAYTHAWERFGLMAPPTGGGWVNADWQGGWTCHVEQGHYGHAAPKATWLYAFGCDLSSLPWGRSGATGTVSGWRRSNAALGRVHTKAAKRTPEPFRDLLLSMARTVR